MFRNFLWAIPMLALPGTALAENFTAILSCGMQGQHINILACFEDTDLKITKGNRSQVFKIYNILDAGQQRRDGLHINLGAEFEIRAQNSHDVLVLGLIIVDEKGNIRYEDQAGRYGTMIVSN